MSKTPYEILGVPPDATEQQIKSAYKKLAKKHHPDLNGGDKTAEDKFKEISQAYTMLTQPAKDTPPHMDGNFDFGFHDLFNDTIFNHIFRGGPARTINRVRVNPQLLISGGSFDYVVQTMETRNGRLQPVHRSVKIMVEPDTPVMAQIAVPNTGPQHVLIQLIPGDTELYRVTDFIHLTQCHQIDVFRAMVGGEIEITAPNGKQMKFNIQPGTQHGAIHRLRGLGLRAPDGQRGDYNVQFVVFIPAISDINEQELKKYVLKT